VSTPEEEETKIKPKPVIIPEEIKNDKGEEKEQNDDNDPSQIKKKPKVDVKKVPKVDRKPIKPKHDDLKDTKL